MTDRIRNALQAIECITFAANSEATEPVRNAVDVIENVLHEVLAEHRPVPPRSSPQSAREIRQS